MTIANKSKKELHDSLVESFRLLGHTAEEAEAAANGGEGRTVLRAFKATESLSTEAIDAKCKAMKEASKPTAAVLKELEAGRTPRGVEWRSLSASASAKVTESFAKANGFRRVNGIWTYPVMTGNVSESSDIREATIQGWQLMGFSREAAEIAADKKAGNRG